MINLNEFYVNFAFGKEIIWHQISICDFLYKEYIIFVFSYKWFVIEQVNGFMEGERDYSNLKGNTGPLVYPAGFLYR